MKDKIYSLVGFDGHAFDGIILKDSQLSRLINELEKADTKVVALNVTSKGIQVLVDKPITESSTSHVVVTEQIIDRKGKLKHHKAMRKKFWVWN